ncbi:MAG: hypothetical protein O3C20_22755, partial [Verrucomicrobia bacterium]|nr:hypothetical protein [Verrucomicrobiota bacterium]
ILVFQNFIMRILRTTSGFSNRVELGDLYEFNREIGRFKFVQKQEKNLSVAEDRNELGNAHNPKSHEGSE